METEAFQIAVDHPRIDNVSAFWHPVVGGDRPAILLAHGSGSRMESPFQNVIAQGLVQRGFPVLRFQYPYRELALQLGKQRPPDRAPLLEDCHERALAALRERLEADPGNARRVVLAGKSLGGRMATHLAAKDVRCDALVLFGYPLHPAKKPEKLRQDHFPTIAQPALFLQGTRDALCDLDLLRPALERFGGRTRLEVIDDADHSFHVRKSSGRDDAAVVEELLNAVDAWEALR